MEVDRTKTYPLPDALTLLPKIKLSKLDETVELHINTLQTGLSGQMKLPHGTGKTKKVAAFVNPEKRKEAEEAGADLIGGEEEIAQIKATGKIDFDVAVATPDMMPKLALIARILGPKGLMPNPKTNTVTDKIRETVTALKKGTIAFKNDDTGNVHAMVGKVSFTNQQLKENIEAFMDALRRTKPASTKGIFLRSATLTSSMGPGIHLAV